MKKTNIILLFIAVMAITLGSCSKDGTDGIDGADGNANVFSQIISINGSDWTYDANAEMFYYDFNTNLLSAPIIDNGCAILYLESGNNVWMALPYLTMGFAATYNTLEIITGGDPTTTTYTFKLVVIEGNAISKNINLNNYNEVKNFYNLKD